MVTTDTLSTLIKSLSKSEKRYFKLFCSLQEGSKGYLYLYDLIRQGVSGKEMKLSFTQRYPKASFDTARKHLYRMLMKSLRSYGSENSVENKLVQLIEDVKILFDRGITALCFAELEKGKNLALRHEKFYYYLILARLELQYLTYLEFPHLSEAQVVSKQEKMREVLEQEQLINRHTALYEILFYRYLHRGMSRSQQQSEQLNDLLLEEHQVNIYPLACSFASDKVHLLFQSIYFLMTGNGEESLNLFYELNELFQQNTHLWQDDPIYYLYLINGILITLRSIGKYEAMPFFIGRLENISQQAPGLRGLAQLLIYQHQMGILIDQRKFEAGISLLKKYEEQNMQKQHTTPNIETTIYFQSAVVYFGHRRFQQALHCINQVLNAPRTYISNHLYVLCRLLNLLIHFELNNQNYLKYEIRSVERKLKAERKLFRVEQAVITFFKRWIKGLQQKQLLLSFQRTLDTLDDPYDRQLLKLLDLRSWVASKIAAYTT